MEPASKKEDLAQAGRKKLEDFRRKKAEAAAAKAKGKAGTGSKASTSKDRSSDASASSLEEKKVVKTPKVTEEPGVSADEIAPEHEKAPAIPSPSANPATNGSAGLSLISDGRGSISDGRGRGQEGSQASTGAGVSAKLLNVQSQITTAKIAPESVQPRASSAGLSNGLGFESDQDRSAQGTRASGGSSLLQAGLDVKSGDAGSGNTPSSTSASKGLNRGSSSQPTPGNQASGGMRSSLAGPDDASGGSTETRPQTANPDHVPGSYDAPDGGASSSSPEPPQSKAVPEPAIPTTIPLLSPSIPSPSPSPQWSPSPSRNTPSASNPPISITLASAPPPLPPPTPLAPVPPQTAPPRAAIPVQVSISSQSRQAVPIPTAAPATESMVPAPTLPLSPVPVGHTSALEPSRATLAPAAGAPAALNERTRPENSVSFQPLSRPSDTRQGQIVATSNLATEADGLAGLPVEDRALTLGSAARGGSVPAGPVSARLSAAGNDAQIASARRRLDYVFASEAAADTGPVDPANPGVPRVQSQPSFKDYVAEQPEPQPAVQRSRTPDPLGSAQLPSTGLAQTASSLRSSLANLFAPATRPDSHFPRPSEIASFWGEEMAEEPRASVRNSQEAAPSVDNGSNGSQVLDSTTLRPNFRPPISLGSQPPPSQPSASESLTAPTAPIPRYPRSPFVPVTANPAEAPNMPPARPALPDPLPFVPALTNANATQETKPVGVTNRVDKPASPPIWSRPRPPGPPIDLNPSAFEPQPFTFPSPAQTPPPSEQTPAKSEKALLRAKKAQANGKIHAPSPAYASPPLSPRARSQPIPAQEEGVVINPRRGQALSPRRRPRSPVPDPLSVSSPPPLRPISTHPNEDSRRRSSSSSVNSTGDKKEEQRAESKPAHNGKLSGESSEAGTSDQPATSAPALPPAKPTPKRSLLQSALAPPRPVRNSFPSASDPNGPSREKDDSDPPARRSFTLPAPAVVLPSVSITSASSSGRSPRGENGNSRLLRLPSMPTVDEAVPSPERERADGGDFASLEQHIEDLTQEKFALQRGAEAARALAASLEEENSRLTEDFNRQAQAVQTLKADLERQQAEIKAQQLVAEAMAEERERLQRENAGALEQAAVMGREVVNLEEQVLKLRSAELKLRKELEATQNGHDAARRQLTTLAADRAALRQMMDALQEERRLLVAKLRQLGVKNALEDVRHQVRSGAVVLERSDATTSTDDLPGPSRTESSLAAQTAANQSTDSPTIVAIESRTESEVRSGGTASQTGAIDSAGQPETRNLNLMLTQNGTAPGSSAERVAAAVAAAVLAVQNSPTTSRLGRSGSSAAGGSLPVPSGIADDQARVIENVNRLMDEIASERRAMAAALAAETEACEELRVSNSELSRKLAVALEQLRAINAGALEGPAPPLLGGPEIPRVDEGDEVVERVLEWISQFFAGRR